MLMPASGWVPPLDVEAAGPFAEAAAGGSAPAPRAPAPRAPALRAAAAGLPVASQPEAAEDEGGASKRRRVSPQAREEAKASTVLLPPPPPPLPPPLPPPPPLLHPSVLFVSGAPSLCCLRRNTCGTHTPLVPRSVSPTEEKQTLPSGAVIPFYAVVHVKRGVAGGPTPAGLEGVDFLRLFGQARTFRSRQCKDDQCSCLTEVISNGERPYSPSNGCDMATCCIKEALRADPVLEAAHERFDAAVSQSMFEACAALGIPSADVQLDAPLSIHSPFRVRDGVAVSAEVDQGAQAPHCDNMQCLQYNYNGGMATTNSTYYYAPPEKLPEFASQGYSFTKEEDYKRWSWDTLCRPPEELMRNSFSIALEPGEGLFFLGPMPHYAPAVSASEMRVLGFRTATLRGRLPHDNTVQHLPWTLAVEYDKSVAQSVLRRLVVQYAKLGQKPWLSWDSTSAMHKMLKGWWTANAKEEKTLAAFREEERFESIAKGRR